MYKPKLIKEGGETARKGMGGYEKRRKIEKCVCSI